MSKSTDRLVYTDANGSVHCVSPKALAALPSEFEDTLTELILNLQLALDCNATFGGIPTPVAMALLRNIEPAHAAIDLAVRSMNPTKGLVH